MALGLALIYGVLHIINFAHGSILMLALYAAFFLFRLAGVDPYVAILILAPAHALALVEQAAKERVPVLGIDGFHVSGSTVQPDLSHSTDYSRSESIGNWQAASQFLREHAAAVSGFEVVLGESGSGAA